MPGGEDPGGKAQKREPGRRISKAKSPQGGEFGREEAGERGRKPGLGGRSSEARKPGKEVGSEDLGGKLERENPPGGELGSKKLGRGFGRQEARSREAVLGGLVLESVPNVKKCLGEAAPIPPEGPAGI
jgi:hypothetical protein